MDDTREKSKRKVRSMWSVEAEELMLVLWSQNVESLRGNRKNTTILGKMSAKMEEMGYPYTGYEIKVKIHNLTNKYRIERKRVSEGLISAWPLYESVHKILGVYQPAFQKIEDNSHGTEDYFSSNPTPSEVSDEDNYYEDINEDCDQNDVVEAPTAIAKCNEPLYNERMYLRSINRNMELLIELQKRSQSMERERTATLKQLLDAFKNNIRSESNSSWDDSRRPRKKIKLSNSLHNDEDLVNYIRNDDPLDHDYGSEDDQQEEEINDENIKQRTSTVNPRNGVNTLDTKIKEEFLKTKQLERSFMIEKHNLQMDILKLELEAKKKLNSQN